MSRPAEKNNDAAAPPLPADMHRSIPTPFLIKTFQLVDDSATDDIISWNEDGTTFIVWRPAEFARDLLPNCFKHNNFSSFVRQLNTYGFRKIVPDRWEFSNEFFRKGEKQLLCDIHRRKNSQANAVVSPNKPTSPSISGEDQGWSSISSPLPHPAEASGLLDENEKLKQQNMHLKSEVEQMKNICEDILAFISNHSNISSEHLKELASHGGSLLMLKKDSAAIDDCHQSKAVKALPSQVNGGNFHVKIEREDADEESPKLFGVRLVSKKRSRDVEEKSQVHGNNSVKCVKVELGLDLSVKQEDAPWLKFCSSRNEKVCN